MSKKAWISVTLLVVAVVFSWLIIRAGFLLPEGGVSGLLLSGRGFWLPILVVASALVDSINPCAISVLLLTIAFLFNLGKDRGRVLKIGGAYVAGIFFIYILIGLSLIRALELLNTPNLVAKLGAGIVIVWGIIELVNIYFPSFPIKLKIPNFAHKGIAVLIEKSSLPAALTLGVFVGLTEFPCTGGPYLFILGLLHDRTTFLGGLGYLVLYNLIFVAPLLVILFVGSDRGLLERVKEWKKTNARMAEIAGSFLMIGLGVLIFLFI